MDKLRSDEMIYGINDKLPFRKMVEFGIQMVLSVFVATVLIANICGVATSGALIGAALSTLTYIAITRGQSPMFLSNSGAFVAPVLFAMEIGGYSGALLGGVTACLIYCVFGVVFTKIPPKAIYKVFPATLIGAVTAVIGITLMGFIPTYIGDTNQWGIGVALITMLTIAFISHYAKGTAKILPFLLGIMAGYALSAILTITGVCKLIDFSVFKGLGLIQKPDFAFTHMEKIELTAIAPIVLMYAAYTVSAMMEAMSDHAALGGIIGVDLYEKPGLGKIFFAEGAGNFISALFGGLGSCSYGESVATIGFSKVASVRVTATAAIMLGMLGFISPVQAFIASIPSCVFAGAAIILYGFIACSGVKMLQKVDLNNSKNLIIVSSVLSIGISGIAIGGKDFALSGTALALIVGVILNLVMKENADEKTRS